ncbi:MAG: hypothetical protein O3B47_01275 [bacterium]|nr:hypothetical protein [bacterium]
MKNFTSKFIVVFLLMNLALTIQMAMAAPKPADVPSPAEFLQTVGKQTGLPDYVTPGTYSPGQHPDAIADVLSPGVGTISSPIYFALDMFRYVISTIAFVVIIIAAMKLVSYSSEEEAGKAKDTIVVGGIGLFIIQLADPIVKQMFFGEQGEAFEDLATNEIFAENTISHIRGIIGFVQILLASAAVLTIVIRGFYLVTSSGSEEEMGRAKSHIIYAIVGMAIVGLSEIIVRGVIFPEAGKVMPDINQGRLIIVKATNFIASFVGILAFAGLFYSGYRYVTAGGNEEETEKVKKGVLGAVLALLLALGAFAAVNTFVTFEEVVAPMTPPPAPQSEAQQ